MLIEKRIRKSSLITQKGIFVYMTNLPGQRTKLKKYVKNIPQESYSWIPLTKLKGFKMTGTISFINKYTSGHARWQKHMVRSSVSAMPPYPQNTRNGLKWMMLLMRKLQNKVKRTGFWELELSMSRGRNFLDI